MMTHEEQLASRFLRKHHMHPENIDFGMCVRESEADMAAGLAGARVSYEMLPCYLAMEPFRNTTESEILVLDAGGTNLRVATVRYGADGELEICIQAKRLMPGVEKEAHIGEVFDTIARCSAPFLSSIARIGFCFSYAMDMQENQDGKIRFICKSIDISDAPGALVGEGLNQALVCGGGQRKAITVVNDSVAVTLAARSGGTEYGGYIGMIIGTGFNICYAEYTCNIAGIDTGRYGRPDMLVNMESDRFFKMERGTFDRRYEDCTGDNDHPTMKMLTGAYLGGLCRLTFLGAAEEGLISHQTAQALVKIGAIETEDLCRFLEHPLGDSEVARCCGTTSDTKILQSIALLLIERAAKLVAAILVPVLRRSYRYRPDRPVCICVEGSTIQKVPTMREQIRAYLLANTDAETEAFEMISVDNATIRGAAIAALQYGG